MVGSFVIFCIALIARIVVGTLTGKFKFLTLYVPYLNYACIGFAALFVVFVFIKIFKSIFGKR